MYLQIKGKEDKLIKISDTEIKDFLKTIDKPETGSTFASNSLRWYLIEKYKTGSNSVVHERNIQRNENLFYILEQTNNSGEILARKPGKTAVSFVNNIFIVGFLENE